MLTTFLCMFTEACVSCGYRFCRFDFGGWGEVYDNLGWGVYIYLIRFDAFRTDGRGGR